MRRAARWGGGTVAAVVAIVLAGAVPAIAQTSTPDVDELISQAGNTEDEQRRYELLVELDGVLGPDDPLRSDLELLLPVVDQWANGLEKYWEPGDQEIGEDGYLAGFFNFRATPAEPGEVFYPPEISADSPLFPIWAMYRGRMLIQQSIQTGFIQRGPGREQFQGQGREMLRIASEAFPENRVLRMWLDEPIPWERVNPVDPDAPQWASLQREALEKLDQIIDFWIDERQAPDGQFGGGWGDDVEMWRTWTPILVGFTDQKVQDAQRLLAEGLWDLPRMAEGYSDILTDVEHSGEDSGDTVTAMLHVDPNDPVWAARATRLAELMRDVWTSTNELDQRQFRSVYFTADEISPDPLLACDTPYHNRAVQPTLLLWQRTRDAALTELFTDWLDTWVDATARAERGKPAGVVPAALSWPSGETGGPEPDWWDPGCAIELDRDLYAWPSFVSPMLRTMVLAFWITGDEQYLEPLQSMAEVRRQGLAADVADPEPGTAEWAAIEMAGPLAEALAKYRMVTGDETYDDLLTEDASPYMSYRLTGDDSDLLAALEDLVAAFGVNRESYTTEVRWTDRVFRFNSWYGDYYAEEPLGEPDPSLLYSMVTGDPGDAQFLPLNAVRWQTDPRDIAVLVDSHGPDHLTARLYHFGGVARSMGAELLVLDEGEYQWSLGCAASIEQGSFTAEGTPTTVEFNLPPGQECTFAVVADADLPTDSGPSTTGEAVDDDGDESDVAASDGSGDDSGSGVVVAVVAIAAVVALGGFVALIAMRRRREARDEDRRSR